MFILRKAINERTRGTDETDTDATTQIQTARESEMRNTAYPFSVGPFYTSRLLIDFRPRWVFQQLHVRFLFSTFH